MRSIQNPGISTNTSAAITAGAPGYIGGVAGEAIAAGALVQVGSDDLIYQVRETDWATQATAGAIMTVTLGSRAMSNSARPVVSRHEPTGALFLAGPSAAGPSSGLAVTKLRPNGTGVGQTTIDAGNFHWQFSRALVLSNGNVAVVAQNATSAMVSFWLFNQDLAVVSAQHFVEAAYGTLMDAIALAAGGFALCYQQLGTPSLQRLAIYDNAGTSILAPTTIQTWTGTVDIVMSRMVQISNGDIAIACSSRYTTTVGLYHAVRSVTGTLVAAMTLLDAVSTSAAVEISAGIGFYAISRANGTNRRAWVLSNAGAVQGAAFSAATTDTVPWTKSKIVFGGSRFFLLWDDTVASAKRVTSLPYSGSGYVTQTVPGFFNNALGVFIDAFFERDRLVMVAGGSGNFTGGSVYWGAFNPDNVDIFTVSSLVGTSALPHSFLSNFFLLPLGDTAFVVRWFSSTADNLAGNKWAPSAVLGVSLAAAAKGEVMGIVTSAGSYVSTAIPGTHGRNFNHNAASPVGNKGTLFRNGVVLGGI